ncbi:hypothetical protein VNO77_37594 [Canavalia gladiata]|uniref:Uncharacterized protein n=1 Tax=Canavalia gladiata TaxID=3824 RepID=A0AAN9PYJ7_CANGL
MLFSAMEETEESTRIIRAQKTKDAGDAKQKRSKESQNMMLESGPRGRHHSMIRITPWTLLEQEGPSPWIQHEASIQNPQSELLIQKQRKWAWSSSLHLNSTAAIHHVQRTQHPFTLVAYSLGCMAHVVLSSLAWLSKTKPLETLASLTFTQWYEAQSRLAKAGFTLSWKPKAWRSGMFLHLVHTQRIG